MRSSAKLPVVQQLAAKFGTMHRVVNIALSEGRKISSSKDFQK